MSLQFWKKRPQARADTEQEFKKWLEQLARSSVGTLYSFPEEMGVALRLLQKTREILYGKPSNKQLALAWKNLVQVATINTKVRNAKIIPFLSVSVVILLVTIVFLLASNSLPNLGLPPAVLNSFLWIGVPVPVWFWAAQGSLLYMLLSMRNFPNPDIGKALLWILYRPLAGTLMGIMTYLFFSAEFLPFDVNGRPLLIWILALGGSFNERWFTQILQRLMNEFSNKKEESLTED